MKIPFRIALVGCGAITQNFYAPALRSLSEDQGLEVVSISDINSDNLLKLKSIFPNAIASKSLESIDLQNIDLAIIASPPEFHCDHTLYFLEKSISVLCEKPLSLNYTQTQKMVQAAQQNNCVLNVGLVRRFFPVVDTIDFLISNQTFGKVLYFNFFEGQYFSWPIQSPSIFQRKSAVKGVFHDIGVHGLDLIFKWFKAPTYYKYKDNAIDGVPTTVDLEFEFEEKIEGKFLVSWDTPLRNSLFIEFEKASLEWHFKSTSKIDIIFNKLPQVLHTKIAKNLASHSLERMSYFNNEYAYSFIQQLVYTKDLVQAKVGPKITYEEMLQLSHYMDIMPLEKECL